MNESEEKLTVWQMFMVALSVFAIGLLAFQVFKRPTGELSIFLNSLDEILCAFFFGDFVWQLYAAKSKKSYLKWGWLDLLSSIPADPCNSIATKAV